MTGKACGCYSMDSRIANAAIVHNINFTSMHGETLFDVNDFLSIRFTNLYMKDALLRNIPANYFDDYEKIIELDDKIQKIINHINDNNGFVVVGWYKRGEIEDRGNKDRDQVDAANMSIHPVSIYPYYAHIASTAFIKTNMYDFNNRN